MDNPRIEIKATVEEFAERAMTDHFESGAEVSYAATALRLGAPERFAGRHLAIFHDQEVPADGPWRQVGRLLRFKILESLLTSEDVLFVGAVHDLVVE
ncbi:MAG: hypothetical protein ABJC13_21350 [Acidobacteriota bacterium]